MDIAVVLISRNQERNIARLIESVLQETACFQHRDIVLVDSASTDGTIERAYHYPIRILRLRPDQQLTPAAGRYIGYKYTTGDLVLFLDGDMELCPGWLEKALRVIQNRPEVAVVTGKVVDLPTTAGNNDKPPLDNLNESSTEVQFAGGAAMYRRSVLEQVGTFNPYLYSEEEPELCLRIRHAGYHILQLGSTIVYHYSNPSEALSTVLKRWRRNLYLGLGQNMRYLLNSELLWPYTRERGYGCMPTLGLAIGFISFFQAMRVRQWEWGGLWVLVVATLLSVNVYRKRSLYRTIHSLLLRLVIIDGTVRGFLSKPLDPRNYPSRLDVIR